MFSQDRLEVVIELVVVEMRCRERCWEDLICVNMTNTRWSSVPTVRGGEPSPLARRWYQYITLKCSNNQTVTQLRRHMLTGRIFGVEIIFLLGEIFSTSDLEIFLCFSLQSVLSPTCQHTSSIQLFPPFCTWCRDNGNLNSHILYLCIALSKMPWYRLVGGAVGGEGGRFNNLDW